MNKPFTLFIACFIFCTSFYGQNEIQASQKDTAYVNLRPSFQVHYYALSHFHYFRPAILFGFEPKLNDKLGLNVRVGYLSEKLFLYDDSDNFLANYRVQDLEGYYVALEPKIYPYINTRGKKSSTFISILLDMHDQDATREERILRQGGAYQQIMAFNRTEQSYTQMINVGTSLAAWGFINLDFSAGIGHRYIKIDNDLPLDAELLDNNNVSRGEKISGNLNRLAFNLSLYLTFPATKNGHRPN